MSQDYTFDINFPLLTEKFIHVQQQEIGRDLYPKEQELCGILVPCLNDAFEDGRSGEGRYPLKYEDFRAEIEKAEGRANEGLCRSLCAWVNYAWACGRSSASTQEVIS